MKGKRSVFAKRFVYVSSLSLSDERERWKAGTCVEILSRLFLYTHCLIIVTREEPIIHFVECAVSHARSPWVEREGTAAITAHMRCSCLIKGNLLTSNTPKPPPSVVIFQYRFGETLHFHVTEMKTLKLTRNCCDIAFMGCEALSCLHSRITRAYIKAIRDRSIHK